MEIGAVSQEESILFLLGRGGGFQSSYQFSSSGFHGVATGIEMDGSSLRLAWIYVLEKNC